MSTLGTVIRVLRAEGALAVRDRLLDRLAEARRASSFPARPQPVAGAFRATVLDLLATPPAPRLGGVQSQVLRRLEAQTWPRTTALLYPTRHGYRLELSHAAKRQALVYPGPPLPRPPALDDRAFEEVVLRATEALGADRLHVEGLVDLPLGSLSSLVRRGLRLVVSLHDFAAFCPRPNLFERPRLAFCCYSRDAERCARCLAQDWPIDRGWQERRRAIAEELLAAAEHIAYPSDFLRRAHLELFPALDPARQRVIPPEPAAVPPERLRVPRTPPQHLAFVGSVQPHKGALVFEEVVHRFGRTAGVRWSVYGGGDAEILARLRRLPGVRVRGYYRSGSLPRLLAGDEVDLALLLSIVPESYGFTLSECRAAGLPVIAFDLGALGERLSAEGGGFLVPLAAGAAGVATLLSEVLAGRREAPSPFRGRC